jgi:hypothetical protein
MRSGRSRDQRPRFPPPSLGGRPVPVLALDDASCANPTLTSFGVASASPPVRSTGATRTTSPRPARSLSMEPATSSPRPRRGGENGRSRSTCGPRTMGPPLRNHLVRRRPGRDDRTRRSQFPLRADRARPTTPPPSSSGRRPGRGRCAAAVRCRAANGLNRMPPRGPRRGILIQRHEAGTHARCDLRRSGDAQ